MQEVSLQCNYILFATETGPLTKKDSKEGEQFLKALRALSAHGGDDCPELAFTGMENALDAGPQDSSSMFVFTDAPPKDAEDNKDTVIDKAHDQDVKINFFITHGCDPSDSFKPFYDVAYETGGHVYELKKTTDLKQLGKLVSTSMQNPILLSTGTGNSIGRRRRTTGMEYRISADILLKESPFP